MGLIIPDSSNMLFADISKNLEDVFFEKKFNIIVFNSVYNVEREIEHMRTLRSKMVDGIIMITAPTVGAHISNIVLTGILLVLLNTKIHGLEVNCIMADNYLGGYLTGKHLIGLGHKSIRCINRLDHQYHSSKRRRGFESALSATGVMLRGNIVKGGFYI